MNFKTNSNSNNNIIINTIIYFKINVNSISDGGGGKKPRMEEK